MRQQYGITYSVWQIVEATQLVRHRMHVAKRSIVKGHTCEELRIGHGFARLSIAALFHGDRQVFRNHGDGFKRARIGNRGRGNRNIGFNSVSQRIHTGSRRQRLRHTDHQRGVIDGQQRCNMLIHNRHFNVAYFIGDDAEAGHFRCRTRRGVNGDHRQLRFCRAVNAFVITNIAAVSRHQRNPLRTIVRGTAAERNNAITVIFFQHFQASSNVTGRGVRMRTIINYAENITFLQRFLNIASHT